MVSRLINNIVLSSILMGVPLMNLPLNGQTINTEKLQKLKEEIRLRTDKIRKTVKTLNIIKKTAPFVVAAAGVALTAIAVVVAAILFLLPLRKLKKVSDMNTSFLNIVTFSGSYKKNYRKNMERLLPKTLKNKILLLEPSPQASLEAKSLAIQAKPFIEKQLKRAKLHLAFIGVPAAIIVALVGITGTVGASIGSFFIMSALASAYDGAKKLEQLEKKHPGILTLQQKKLLKKFDNLSKDLTVQASIKGIKIREAKKAIINVAIQQHPALVATLGGQQKARKIFSIYIGLKWKENIFQKLAGAATGIVVKLPLKNITKRIKKVETQHPPLKPALESSAQAYTTQVNSLLEKLKNQIVEAAEKGKLKPDIIPQPIISL